jgi:hypothetical protein
MIIGYLPDACFHHQYTGELSELRRFTLDFVRGEIRYLADAASEPGSHLIELPVEWITQGNFDRSLARALLKRALHDARRGRDRARRREYLATAMRWLAPAIFGDRVRRAKSSIAVLAASIRVRFTKLFGSSRKLNGAFTTWVAALIHHQRLSSIATARKAKGRAGLHGSSRSPTGRLFAPDHAGFHPIESFQGTTFRWSETAAMVRIDLPAGLNRIEIECAPLFPLATLKELRFHLDGQDISDGDVPIESFRIVIDVGVDRAGRRTLGWTCRRFDAPGDPRVLGLPLAKIEVVAAT